MTIQSELPVPEFYDSANAGKWEFRPDQQRLFEAAISWRDRHTLAPAAEDAHTIHLLLVDLQKDFCFPGGSLYVGGRSGRGAIEDSDRTARFIYRNLANISAITCTMDTHYPYQIFSPAFWLDESGRPPAPHQEITSADLERGRVRPNPAVASWLAAGDYAVLQRQVEHYCRELESRGKYRLYLWPPHCLLGSAGHALAGVIHEARLFHSYARVAPAAVEAKGDTPLTEYYSVIGPEVLTRFDGSPMAEKNTDSLRILFGAEAVIIAGQAASHCVKSTIEDLLDHFQDHPAEKVYILQDCMSAVAVPDPARPGEFVFDFTPQAEEALARFQAAGMHVVDSTTPMAAWPDFPSA